MFTAIKHNVKEDSGFPGIINPAQVMVKNSSGYKILDLYVRKSTGHVYALNGNYFICLMQGGLTSNAKVTWHELDGIDENYDKCYFSYYENKEWDKNEKN